MEAQTVTISGDVSRKVLFAALVETGKTVSISDEA